MSASIAGGTLLLGLTMIQGPSQEKQSALQQKIKEEEERSSLLLSIHSQKGEIKRQEKRLVLEGSTADLTSAVSRLASKSGVQIESVSPQPEIDLGGYTRIQVQLTATAAFSDIVGFIHAIEQHEPLLKVEQLQVAWLKPAGGSAPASEAYPSKAKGPPPLPETGRQKAVLLLSAFSRTGKGP
ncbi:MAG: type 4a pilus biogenesis protein PilO [Candidatus Omnitrophica bacterium]|nr:type 4a pilus biogenesis protein PilO [Candidatus Omnitrophota bacterium]